MVMATMSSKGQVTVPKEVREALHLATGSRVVFEPAGEGESVVRAVRGSGSLADLAGCLPRRGAPVTLEQMERAVADGAAASGASG